MCILYLVSSNRSESALINWHGIDKDKFHFCQQQNMLGLYE